MVAFIPSPTYSYLVEYKSSSLEKDPRSIYLYATSEIHVREILADYNVVSVIKE